jgi:uncharacterized protein with NRDE domain
MCLLALFFRVVEDAPLVIGANREEFYARGGEPPQLLGGPLRAVGGRDPVGGGTWLAVNERGVFVAVTNRPKSEVPPTPRSRGLLVRDLLACSSAASAADLAGRELASNQYAGCNVVCADVERLIVLQAGDWLRVRPLPSGIHVLTARDVNDESDRRTAHALAWLYQRRYRAAAECIAALKELCAQSGASGPPICLRGTDRGTVSSSLVVLGPTLLRSSFLHSQGPPDVTPYQDYSSLLRGLASAEGG